MRLTDYDKLQLKLRTYADKKTANGEIELANGILKAKCFIDQECEIVNGKQLNGGWIPVSERLPTQEEYNKNDGRFIVTDGQRVYQSLYEIYEKQSFVDVRYIGNCNFLSTVDEKVTAWMPLPEPYKDEKKENIKSCDTCKKNKTYFDCSQCNDLDEWEAR